MTGWGRRALHAVAVVGRTAVGWNAFQDAPASTGPKDAGDEVEEYVALTDRMGDLLTRTAAALKGPPPPLTMHDWSDLPAVAERVRQERPLMAGYLAEYRRDLLAVADQHDPALMLDVVQYLLHTGHDEIDRAGWEVTLHRARQWAYERRMT